MSILLGLADCRSTRSFDSFAQEINMDYLVPETQSYHLDMGTLSGAGEMDAMGHFRELYLGRGQARGPIYRISRRLRPGAIANVVL